MGTPDIPRLPLKDLAIDFIGPLPNMQGYDMLLSCTCRLTGFTRAIPTNQKDSAEKTARRLFNHWFALFGIPITMISNRDKLWTSRFWKKLMKLLHIDMKLTTAFHPQSDGRSERSNKTITQVLRAFTRQTQRKWLESLPATELAINSCINTSTGYSPFELVFGLKPTPLPRPNREGQGPMIDQW